MTLRAIGSVEVGARFVSGHAVNLRPDPSPCWCLVAACWDHSDYCARCNYRRPRAMLRRVRLNAVQSPLQCIDACAGRLPID